MKEYLVLCRETCPECKGTGCIFRESCFEELEQHECNNCNGTGVHEYHVPLAEALNIHCQGQGI